jgi:hypothetical protein
MKSCCDEQVAGGQLPPNIWPPLAGRSAKLLEKRRTTFRSFMLGVVKRAVLGQCWFHFNSPFIGGGGGLTRALMSE